MAVAVVCVLAFLLGAVPFALLLVRAVKGVDVRTVGSGNVGATNASRAFTTPRGRVLGFVAIYALDAGKGFVPAWFGPGFADAYPMLTGVLAGASALLGHVFNPFLGWRGGKGVATATGALLALDWQATTIAVAVFFVVRWTTGHVFLGSLALGVALAGAAIVLHVDSAFGARLPLTILCFALAAFLFWTHRSNLHKHFAARSASNA